MVLNGKAKPNPRESGDVESGIQVVKAPPILCILINQSTINISSIDKNILAFYLSLRRNLCIIRLTLCIEHIKHL
jgi:hypothetical protein